MDEFERQILKGQARFIADLNESFKDYTINGSTFDLYIRGQTRAKGFALSRFLAWTVLPNYRVAFFGKILRNAADSTRKSILELAEFIRAAIRQQELRWAWLVFFADQDLPSNVQNLVEKFDVQEIGIGVVNAKSGMMIHSNNLLGKSLKRYLHVDRLMSRIGRNDS